MLYNNKSVKCATHNHATNNSSNDCSSHCNNITHNHAHQANQASNQQVTTLTDQCCSTNSANNCCDPSSTSEPLEEPLEEPPEDPLRQPHLDNDDDHNQQQSWHVQGMNCASCAKKVEKALQHLANISQVRVTFATEKLIVTASKMDRSLIKQIEDNIIALGYKPTREQDGQPHQHAHTFDKKAFIPLAVLAGLIIISYGLLLTLPTIGYYAFIITALIGIVPIAKKALIAARRGSPFSIEMLMSIAALGALFIGASEEATMVIFLFMIGEMLEGISASKAKQGITALMALMPDETTLIKDGVRSTISSKLLKPDDIIEVSAGGRLPADVLLLSPQAVIDESALTGESIPVEYQMQDKILAGSLIIDKTVQFKVISQVGQNAVDHILQLIEDAEERKAPIERFIDRFSQYYTPIIVLLAVFIVIIPPLFMHEDWYTWVYRGLTLLLIGCPCALVISTPAAITSGLSSAAKQGVLIKGGAALENLGSIQTIAFDKTGTLTQGKPQVTDIMPNHVTRDILLSTAAAVESGSHHPLAKAIVELAKQDNLTIVDALQREAIAGIGIKGEVNGELIHIIAPNKLNYLKLALDEVWHNQINQLEEQGKTVVVVATEQQLFGLIALQDTLRHDAVEAIKQLHDLGLKTIMLTGDNQRAAKAIATQLNMQYQAELLPADKLRAIEKINQQSPTAMVGDGINDSPAMKAATVGIAMGSGTDVALETADAALTKNSLLSIAKLIRLTRATNSNIRQNITLALGFKAIFLVTTILGITGLWIAVLADSGTTALVTLNALRLLRKK